MPTTATSVGTAPSLIFTPQVNAQSVTITNTGVETVYLGQTGVTAATGLPLPAGLSINLTIVPAALYAVSGAPNLKSPTATTSGSVIQGATALPVASGGTSFTNGMLVYILDGNNTELVTVGAGSTGTSVVVSATAFAHGSGVTFGQLDSTNNAAIKVSYGAS